MRMHINYAKVGNGLSCVPTVWVCAVRDRVVMEEEQRLKHVASYEQTVENLLISQVLRWTSPLVIPLWKAVAETAHQAAEMLPSPL